MNKQKEKTRVIGLKSGTLVEVTGKVIEIKEYQTSDNQTAHCFLLKNVLVHEYNEYLDHVWVSYLKESNKMTAKSFSSVEMDDVIRIEGFSQKYYRKKVGDIDYSIRRINLKQNYGKEFEY